MGRGEWGAHHNKCVVIQMRCDGCVLGEAGELTLHESVLDLVLQEGMVEDRDPLWGGFWVPAPRVDKSRFVSF